MKQKTWTPDEVKGYVQWYEDGIQYTQSGMFYTAKKWHDAVSEIRWPNNDMSTLEQYQYVETHLIRTDILPDPFQGLDFIDEL